MEAAHSLFFCTYHSALIILHLSFCTYHHINWPDARFESAHYHKTIVSPRLDCHRILKYKMLPIRSKKGIRQPTPTMERAEDNTSSNLKQ
jgi:hypothetical protein